MSINDMTKEQFKALPIIKEKTICDNIVLLPTKIKDQSGYNLYQIVVCLRDKPLGKTYLYDTFSLTVKSAVWERIGIDCLRKSGLMRIFFKKSIAYPSWYNIEIEG